MKSRQLPANLKANRNEWIRRSVQILFFIIVLVISINHDLEKTNREIPWLSSASLHAICPFGGAVSIYDLLTDGTYAQKTHPSSFILMIIVFVLAIGFGPAFCGWVCPMGSIQEWVGALGRRLFKKRYNAWLPPRLDKGLRYLRYGVLVWVLYMTASTGKLIFETYDPYAALFNLWSSELSIIGLALLGAVLLLALFVERPFCKYACPYGAVLGLTNLFRVFAIRRNASTCISCSACTKACPMNIDVAKAKTVRDHQCISCLRCTSEQKCPVKATVLLSTLKEIRYEHTK